MNYLLIQYLFLEHDANCYKFLYSVHIMKGISLSYGHRSVIFLLYTLL